MPRSGRSLFYENIARYLLNGYADETLARLAGQKEPLSLESLPETARWTGKLRRDFERPYTDEQALSRLDHLQSELADLIRLLGDLAPRGGYSLSIMGGLLRGRLSAHSDLDLMLATDDARLLQAVLRSPFGYLVKAKDAVVGPVPRNPALLKALGPTLALGDGAAVLSRPGFLREIFLQARDGLSAADPGRDFPISGVALVEKIKRLGRALDETSDSAQRLGLERKMDDLVQELLPSKEPADALLARARRATNEFGGRLLRRQADGVKEKRVLANTDRRTITEYEGVPARVSRLEAKGRVFRHWIMNEAALREILGSGRLKAGPTAYVEFVGTHEACIKDIYPEVTGVFFTVPGRSASEPRVLNQAAPHYVDFIVPDGVMALRVDGDDVLLLPAEPGTEIPVEIVASSSRAG